MADRLPVPTEFPHLADAEVALYRTALREGGMTAEQALHDSGLPAPEAARALAVLVDLHLLRKEDRPPDGTDPGTHPGSGPGTDAATTVYRPVSPGTAVAARVAPVEAELRRQLAEAERARSQLALLEQLWTQGRTLTPSAGLEEVLELPAVLDLIVRLSAGTRTEVLTAQPGGPRAPHQLAQALDRDRATIRRGVRMRTLYQHTARRHVPTQEYVAQVTAAGAEVRTLTELFGRMLVFDREVALLPHRLSLDAAIVVREPSTVLFLCGVFDRAWSSADPYAPLRQWDDSLDDVKQAIVRLLTEGMKDEMIARRLGMSLRTCRKHVAELMELLGASSRFQAGYLAHARAEAAAASGTVVSESAVSGSPAAEED